MNGVNMRARQWVIAASFYDPGDYDIPTAPTFVAEHAGDGDAAETVLYDEDGREVMRARTLMKCRR